MQSCWMVSNFGFAKYWHITADISYFLMRSGNFYQSADYKDATVQSAASWAPGNWFHFHFLATDPGRWHLLHLPTVLYQLQRNAGVSDMVMVERWEYCRVGTVGGNLYKLQTTHYCNPCTRRCKLITSSMPCNDATDLSNAQETNVSCLNADSC